MIEIESTSEVKWDDFEGNGKEIEAKKRGKMRRSGGV